jgi:hypothetical protein
MSTSVTPVPKCPLYVSTRHRFPSGLSEKLMKINGLGLAPTLQAARACSRQ